MTDPVNASINNHEKVSMGMNGVTKTGTSLLDSLASSHLERVEKTYASDSVSNPEPSQPSTELKKPAANLLFGNKGSSRQDTGLQKASSNLLFRNPNQQQLKGSSKGNAIFQNSSSVIEDLKAQTDSLKIGDDKPKKNSLFSKKPTPSVVSQEEKSSEENNPPSCRSNSPITKNLLFQPATNTRNSLFGISNNSTVESASKNVNKIDDRGKETPTPAIPSVGAIRPKKAYRRKIQCFESPAVFSKVDPGLVKRKPSFLGSRIADPCDSRKQAKFFHYSTVWSVLTSDCADRCFKFDTPSPDQQVRLAQLYNRPALGYQQPVPVSNIATPIQIPTKNRPKIAMYDCSHHDF
jgi:hypothetical protein